MRWNAALQDELDRLRKERSALEKLTSKMIAFEAAMIVLAKHNLMVEFADAISDMNEAIAASNGHREKGAT